ncbi:glycosyltransferase [Prevotella sp. KH2C16]|uniref:glycosyltransferase n=1 Tax=Prevotella sp. KH2C16 TaxID=1855325 RepID=UPI0008E511D9|nr:glycosyltransferase [Prevotella sp. KH2C16]SFF99039.1 Glycosyltransferase, catalytic subunit of cellulose synthase and poly-beta-1,6-N-acetylglucosamine synthase [Prevotella sp. KH2C16]
MTLDYITIIGAAVVMVVSLLSVIINPFFRRSFLKKASPDETRDDYSEGDALPPLSVIITLHDNAREMEERLPLYLNQNYPSDFQVVIVSEEGDSETDDILKRFAGDRHLYHTFIPNSSRYVSRKKLAITMGVKAAKNEWILLTDIECRPAGENWLRTMARNARKEKNLVLGVSKYADEAKPYYSFEHIHTLYYVLRKAAKGTAYRTNCANLMFRKSDFLAQNGFSGNLDLQRGEYDFLVNKYAGKHTTAIETSPDAWVIEDLPTPKEWRNKHFYYLAGRSQMQRRRSYRLLYNMDQWTIHLSLLLIISIIAFAVITQRWILAGTSVLCLLSMAISRTLTGWKALRAFEEDMPSWKIYPYEISIVWHNLANIIRYKRADRLDFTSHKL